MKSLFNLLLSIPTTLFGGFIFAHMWNWFILRLFPSAPTLGFLDAVGFLIVVGFPLFSLYIANAMRDIQKDKDIDSATSGIIVSLVTLFLFYPIMFGIAYLWHLVIGA